MSRRVEEPGSRRQCIAAFDYRRLLSRHAPCRDRKRRDPMSYDDETMTFVSHMKFDCFPVCNIWQQLHGGPLLAHPRLHIPRGTGNKVIRPLPVANLAYFWRKPSCV